MFFPTLCFLKTWPSSKILLASGSFAAGHRRLSFFQLVQQVMDVLLVEHHPLTSKVTALLEGFLFFFAMLHINTKCQFIQVQWSPLKFIWKFCFDSRTACVPLGVPLFRRPLQLGSAVTFSRRPGGRASNGAIDFRRSSPSSAVFSPRSFQVILTQGQYDIPIDATSGWFRNHHVKILTTSLL